MVARRWKSRRDAGGNEPPASDPWADRVAIARSGGRSFAYRPDRLVVPRGPWERLPDGARGELLRAIGGREAAAETETDRRGPVVLTGVDDPLAAAARLQDEGVAAQVDHVFFATPADDAVSGAPVMFGGVGGAPVMFGGVGGAPVMFGGVGGAPVMFGGVGGAPVMFGGGSHAPGMWCCGCCPSDLGPPSGPATAPRRSTVQPAAPPSEPTGAGTCRVAVVDTGLAAERFLPEEVRAAGVGDRDEPDADDDSQLDAASGHATFIAAIVEAMVPDAIVDVVQVLSTFGDGADSDVAAALWRLVDDPPDVVNLSFAGYSVDDAPPPAIRHAIAALLAAGVAVVASAGNDATCRPAWPASVDGVVGVAALGPHGPAWFTNHGPWVRACAPGVDVVSRFFRKPESPTADEQPDCDALGDVEQWASWSGTSFAAPIVAGVIARSILSGCTPGEAVAAVVDDPARFRLPGLGTVVNERPW